jgi:wyosine [tRNA(Phe)-imidazoG37] synthetase (radical SAM superfamily)
MIVFGPVPSRRLGRSLGINNIPAKTCSYSCVYCQLGKTVQMHFERQGFYEPERIAREVKEQVDKAKSTGEHIDYLTFVPDGEPTLDIALGEEIDLLTTLEIRIAVITNASLIYREDIRHDLAKADLVSLKVDAVSERGWRRVNRPHGRLKLDGILEGMLAFAKGFEGEIITETMLVDGINDKKEDVERVAEFLAVLEPSRAYVAVPTRPPAEKWVKTAGEPVVNMAYQKISEALGKNRVEYLIGYEGNAFAFTGNVEEDLLSITSVHPMRQDAVEEFLRKANAGWRIVKKLTREEELIELEYMGRKFYMRKLPTRH